MAILKVARLGHPVLRRVADPLPLAALGTADTRRLIDDMIETMAEYDGVGLAAPQVHLSQRLFVYGVAANPRYPDAPPIPLTVLVNPRITPVGDEQELDWEGCLSVPDLRGKVPRWACLEVEAQSPDGRTLRYTAEGFHARILQHELDHLDGKVYLDRMGSMESLAFLAEFQRYGLKRAD